MTWLQSINKWKCACIFKNFWISQALFSKRAQLSQHFNLLRESAGENALLNKAMGFEEIVAVK